MMDPKASVMTYLAENLPPDHRTHGQVPSGQQTGTGIPSNGQIHQFQGQPTNKPQPIPQPNGPSTQRPPQPMHTPPLQSGQISNMQPYFASDLSRPSTPGMQPNSIPQPQNAAPSASLPPSAQFSNLGLDHSQSPPDSTTLQPTHQASLTDTASRLSGNVGFNLPVDGPRKRPSPHSAPRVYHRLVLNYKELEYTFFSVKLG